jgi:protein phosphatase
MDEEFERPPHFPPGTPIGDRYVVEGLVRLSERRMFYLVTDNQSEEGQRYLMSSRWNPNNFDSYERFLELKLDHPGLECATDSLRHAGQLLSFIPYSGEGLMLDEASPLPNERVLGLAQRVLGTMVYLHRFGVRLQWFNRANLLVAPDGTVRLFDLEVCGVDHASTLVSAELMPALVNFSEMLVQYCDTEAEDLCSIVEKGLTGEIKSLDGFGRYIEKNFDTVAEKLHPAHLGGMSDVGLLRQLNEDCWGWGRLSERSVLYVVADGMGGHDSGEVASAMAVETICRVAKGEEEGAPADPADIEQMLEFSFQSANNAIKKSATERGTDMGTTMVCFLQVDEKNGYIANVGDSRAYLLRDQCLHQVSRDHSLVQKMVERGRITREEARVHPHSNILLRTVGTEYDVEIDIFRVDLEEGDRIILCSDGLWGEVDDRDMENILNTYVDPRLATRELVRAAHHGGGKDNVTLVLVAVA